MSSDCNSGSGPLSSCGTRIGLTLIAQSACLSFIAVVSLLTYVSYLAFQNRHRPGWRLVRSHLDLYLLGMLVSDLIQALGGIMTVKWIAMAGVYEGRFCTAQGVFKQLGDVGVALCSLAIAVHTFAELFLRWKEPASFVIPIVVLCFYATFLTLIVGVGYAVHHRSTYYGDTTYWCWITAQFLSLEIGLEYLWLWIAALVNVAVYIPIFLVLKRIIIVDHTDTWFKYRVRRTTPEERRMSFKSDDAVAPRQMLFYPAVYLVTVVPQAIVRINEQAHPNLPIRFPALVFSGMLFSASGVFNVIVFTFTRPALLRPSAVAPDVSKQHSRQIVPRLFLSDPDQVDADASSVPSRGLEGSTAEIDDVRALPLTRPREEHEHDTKEVAADGFHPLMR